MDYLKVGFSFLCQVACGCADVLLLLLAWSVVKFKEKRL